jgi:hypothetical protein
MIKLDSLNELQDDELRAAIAHAQRLLKQRDEDRKAKALDEAKATLAAAGLSLRDLIGKGKGRSGKGPVYHSGHTYQHPTDKALAWNGKGKKPGWLVTLETGGESALEVKRA